MNPSAATNEAGSAPRARGRHTAGVVASPRAGEDEADGTEAGAGATVTSGGRSKAGLSRRASLNAAASMLDYGGRTVVEFVMNPFLVAGLGSYLYGAWRVLWRMTGYLWAASGRSAQVLQSTIANRQGSADDEEKRRHVTASVAMWFVFLPVLAMLGGLGAWFSPSLLKAPPQYVGAVRWTAFLLVVDSIAVTLLTIPRSVLQGENLGYKRMGASTFMVLLGGASTVAAVELGWGLVGVAVMNLVNTLYTGVLFWAVVRKVVPWWGYARPTRTEMGWFFRLTGWFTAWKFVNQLLIAGDVAVLGFFGSVELVTVYSFSKYIPEAILPLFSTLVQGVVPGLGGIIGNGDWARAIKVRNEIMAITWLLSVAISTSVLLWNRSFLHLWVSTKYYGGMGATLLIVVTLIQLSIIRNDAFVIDLTLNVRSKVLVGLAASLLSLGTAAVLIRVFDMGIPGLCIGLISGRLVMTFAYPLTIGRMIGHPFLSQVRGALRPLVASALLLAAGYVIGTRLDVRNWFELVAGSAASGVVVLGLAAFIGLGSAQRAALLNRARAVRARV